MMRATNLIHGLTFDVAYDGSGESSEALAEWLRAALLPVVDEALAQHDQPQKVCRIERLEIDLGEVLREHAEGELARRLHEQLAEALAWPSDAFVTAPATSPGTSPAAFAVASGKTRSAASQEVFHAESSSALDRRSDDTGEQLLGFLRSGRLPWSVAADQQVAHEHLLRRVLASAAAKPVLKAATRDTQMLTRLVRQFSPSTLSEVAYVLHGSRLMASEQASEEQWMVLLSRGTVPSAVADFTMSLSSVQRSAISQTLAMPAHSALATTRVVDQGIQVPAPIAGLADSQLSKTESVSTFAQVLQQEDIAQLARMWPLANASQRDELRVLWNRLPGATRRRYTETIGHHLHGEQLDEFAALSEPEYTPGRVKKPAAVRRSKQRVRARDATAQPKVSTEAGQPFFADQASVSEGGMSSRTQSVDRRNETQVGSVIGDSPTVLPAVADSRPLPEGPSTVAQVVARGDIAQLALMLPKLATSQRDELHAAWSHLPDETRQRYIEAIGQYLSDAQFNEFIVLTQPKSAIDHAQETLNKASVSDERIDRRKPPVSHDNEGQARPRVAESPTILTDVENSRLAVEDSPTIAQVLAQGDITQLALMLPKLIASQREELHAAWNHLPDSTRQRYGEAIGQYLSDEQLNEFIALTQPKSAIDHAPETLNKASVSDEGIDRRKYPVSHGNEGQAGLRVAESPTILTDVANSHLAAEDSPTIAQVLGQGDIAQLARMLPMLIATQRDELHAAWNRLPDATRQHYIEAIGQYLSDAQFNEFIALHQEKSAARQEPTLVAAHRSDQRINDQGIAVPLKTSIKAAVSDGTSESQKRSVNRDSEAHDDDSLAALTDADASRLRAEEFIPAIAQVLEQGDFMRLARMLSTIVASQRDALRAEWNHLPDAIRQRYISAIGRYLNDAQFIEFRALIQSPFDTHRDQESAVVHPSKPRAHEQDIATASKETGATVSAIKASADEDSVDSHLHLAEGAPTITQVLAQGDIEQLVHMLPTLVASQRDALRAEWNRLPDRTRQRYMELIEQSLTDLQLIEFKSLMQPEPNIRHAHESAEVHPSRQLTHAQNTAASSKASVDASRTSLASEASVSGSTRHASESPRTLPEAIVPMIMQALALGDIVQFARMLPMLAASQQEVLQAAWNHLPDATRQRYIDAIGQNLNDAQFIEFRALIQPTSAIRHAHESAVVNPSKPAAHAEDVTAAFNTETGGTGSASKAFVNEDRVDSLVHSAEGSSATMKALAQGDMSQLARMLPTLIASQRDALRAEWNRLPEPTRQRYIENIGQDLSAGQLAEFVALTGPTPTIRHSHELAALSAAEQRHHQAPDIAAPSKASSEAESPAPVSKAVVSKDIVESHEHSASRQSEARISRLDELIQMPAVYQSQTGLCDPVEASLLPEDAAAAIEQALQQGDIEQLARLWPAIPMSQRDQLRTLWQRLPRDARKDFVEAMRPHLNQQHFDEFVVLVEPPFVSAQGQSVANRAVPAISPAADSHSPAESTRAAASPTDRVRSRPGLPELTALAPAVAGPIASMSAAAEAATGVAEPAAAVARLAGKEGGVAGAQPQPQPKPQPQPSLDIPNVPLEEAEPMPPEPISTSPLQIDPALAMFRDWQRQKLELHNLPLTLAELKQWLNWWLMHDPELVNQDCSLMLDAIDSHCAQLSDPVPFMKLVLTALRHGDALDLESLAGQAATIAPTDDKPVAMDPIATLKSHQAIRNFVAQQAQDDPFLAGLNSAQLHQLVRAWIGDTPSLFLTSVEEQALQASDLHLYFRSILESLLSGQAVDLDSLMAPIAPMSLVPAQPTQSPEQDPEPAQSSPLPPLLQQSLPQRLADALLRAELAPLQVIWPEIMRFHADIVIAAAKRYLRRPQERANLASRADPIMLMAMLKTISPQVGHQIKPLILHAARCNAVLPAPLTIEEFHQRLLKFAFEQAMDGSQDNWLAGVMQTLGVGGAWASDVAHAWRAMLPPSAELDCALFGEVYLDMALNDEPVQADAASTLSQMLKAELCRSYPQLVDEPLREQITAELCYGVPAAASNEALLAMLLMRASPLGKVEQQAVALLVQRLLATKNLALTGSLESALCQPTAIARLTSTLPGPVLAQLLVLLQPALAAQIPAALNAMASAIAVANVPAMQSSGLWSTIYQSAFVAADPMSPAEFIRTLVQRGSGRTDLPVPPAVPVTDVIETLEALLKPMMPNEPQAPQQQDEQAWTGESDIRNAGMVIFATYMQRLFGILELTREGKFVSDEASQRAVHLLQYAVNGESSTPEYQLVLNKLFCGIHGGVPIVRGIDITQKEKDIVEQMLNGVIAHWSALGKTSIGGLRQTFLQREGHLYFEEEAWHLKIPQATFDMLLDRLPWSFAMIKFPWMPHPLHVTWR